MKLFIIMIALLASPALAEQDCKTESGEVTITGQTEIRTDVPNYLKSATITVTLADGRSSTVPAERFKVVPRLQQFIVEKKERTTVISCTSNEPRKNRVSVLGGSGRQSGLETSQTGSTLEVSNKVGLVGGLQYQRMISNRLSIGVQGQTNKTVLGNIGLDF